MTPDHLSRLKSALEGAGFTIPNPRNFNGAKSLVKDSEYSIAIYDQFCTSGVYWVLVLEKNNEAGYAINLQTRVQMRAIVRYLTVSDENIDEIIVSALDAVKEIYHWALTLK